MSSRREFCLWKQPHDCNNSRILSTPQLMDGLLSHSVHIFIVPRAWIQTTLVLPRRFLSHRMLLVLSQMFQQLKHVETLKSPPCLRRGEGWSCIFHLVSFTSGSDSDSPTGQLSNHVRMCVCFVCLCAWYDSTVTQLSIIYFPRTARVIILGLLSCDKSIGFKNLHMCSEGGKTAESINVGQRMVLKPRVKIVFADDDLVMWQQIEI